MLSEQYKREMELFGPRQEELERLYTLIEGGTDMKRKKWIGRRAVAAIAVCAALTLTATAAAAPAVWRSLQEHLGPFAPYAQYIKGASCTDQGIKIQMLSAISDDLEARFYLAVQDVEGDRLNEFLTLSGRLTAGELRNREGKNPSAQVSSGYPSTRYFDVVSYNPETKTALISATISYDENARPTREARLEIKGLDTRKAAPHASAPCASVTGAVLKSLSVGKDDKVVYKPGDLGGTGYTDAVLPARKVVLAPGQTPMPLEGTEDIRISSMGFADDGCFHVRLDFAEGVRPALRESGKSALICRVTGASGPEYDVCQQTLVEGGMDILFPLIKAGDLKSLQSNELRVYGDYFRPGIQLEGDWSVDFDLEYHPSVTLDWTGELGGRQVRQVTLSPLSVVMFSSSGSSGGFHGDTLYAVKKDGSTVAAEPGTGGYSNVSTPEEELWDAFNTWKFEEPIDIEDISFLSLKGTLIPVN